MKLGVHDFMLRQNGRTNQEFFEDTKKMVLELDELGYDRYWFAEHHGYESLLAVAPEVIASHFLALTKNIKVGAGGCMIMHYSPLKIAEVFKTMTELAPGRVDIGIGRAPGCGVSETRALNHKFSEKSPELFDEIETILDYLADKKPEDPIYRHVKAVPTHNESMVHPWMLGSTGKAAPKAAEWGLPYSHAKFFLCETPAEVFKQYRSEFKPSVFADKPYISMSYKILLSEDKDELEYLSKSYEYFHIQQTMGDWSGIVDPEEIKDYHFNLNEQAILKKAYENRFILKGNKQEIADILNEEIEEFYLDEILCFTPIFGIENRINTYKILKEIFD
ncbi:MsnO8 family LLM class oxidoreductase [Anaerococcus martiniensis]|uniref:MsnO8 family LLM class oxidoreductase n=1 Tax=Anaerococcus sp. WGS1579 TaxID=3366809 RepID=UPI00372D2298